MAQGLQIFNEGGSLKLDLGKRLPKICGTMTLSGNGTFSIPNEYPNNKLWYYILRAPVSPDISNLSTIRIADDGRSIIWANLYGGGEILWGIY